MNKKSKQITLDNFLNIKCQSDKPVSTCDQIKKPEYKPKKSILKIDLKLAEKILQPLINIKEDIINNYKRERKNISRERVDSYFTVFEDPKVLEIVSLFERPIPHSRKYWRRIATEFHLIRDKNFFEVFKQVKEILLMTRNYPHVIRGSAGCSLVCFLMKITDLDPVYLKIPLTRFMHIRREDIPDIDIDFPALDRDKIFNMIFDRWKGCVARISNHVLFKEKSAIKEAIRKTGYHKFIPKDFKMEDIFDDEDQIEAVYEEAKKLVGGFRNYSLHCGGIVIFDGAVPDDLCLQTIADEQGVQIKLNKDEVEDLNYIKIDILSNRGLSQLWKISKMPILDYPHEDSKVYDFFASGDNLGLTYGESRGMRKIFVEMKPKNIHDIAAALALIRPAAAKNGQKFNFLKTYHIPGKVNRNEFVIYDDDAIEYIARLLKITLSEADIYRKAFAKNKWKLKREFKAKLREAQKSMSNDDIDFICDKLESLQSYSFCKSHAYSYAYLLFSLAYQKLYNPKDFWRATLECCQTSYRKWTHFRAAICAGVRVDKYVKNPVLGNANFKFNQIKEYFLNGFWTSKNFMNGMHVKYDRNIFVSLEVRDKRKIDVRCHFRGLIATCKIFKSDDKIRSKEKDAKKRKNKFITFVTLGYDNNKYIDVVLWGCHKLSKTHCLSGEGIYDQRGHWIKVDKVNYEYLK
jgi:DNA polymerase III alpha subunit